MSARSLSFTDPLPCDAIYADASFILNLITSIRHRPEHFQPDCEDFLRRLQSQMDDSGLCLVTSDFAIDEVLYKIIVESLDGNLPFPDHEKHKTYCTVKDLYKNRPEIIQRYLPKIDAFYRYIDTVPFLVLSCPDLKNLLPPLYTQVKTLIASYNIYPADAYHIAIAKAAEIIDFVALDSDWFRIDDINLYTCLPTP